MNENFLYWVWLRLLKTNILILFDTVSKMLNVTIIYNVTYTEMQIYVGNSHKLTSNIIYA